MKKKISKFTAALLFTLSALIGNVPSNYVSAADPVPPTTFYKSFFSLKAYGGQTGIWTVPATGFYRINTAGGRGGNGYDYPTGSIGGKGAIIQGDFYLTAGERLHYLVGKHGDDSTSTVRKTGGGGGTYVAKQVPTSSYQKNTGEYVTPLVVAGGGGAANDYNENGADASGPCNTCSPNGGNAVTSSRASGSNASGGGGFVGNGATNSGIQGEPSIGGKSFLNGGEGGYVLKSDGVTKYDSGWGGFGGGGAEYGGGGGWSGGTSFMQKDSPDDLNPSLVGGGGTSYNVGSNQGVNIANESDGYLEVSLIVPTQPLPRMTGNSLSSVTFEMPIENPEGIIYDVEVSTDAATGWSPALQTTNKVIEVGGLNEDTLYYVRVRYYYSTYNEYSSYGPTVSIKTKSAVLEAAQNAEAAAQNAEITMNTIISPKLTLVEGAVKDGSGNTALSMATLASQNASSAKTSAENALNAINTTNTNLSTRIDNIQSFVSLKLDRVKGYNNATATRTTSFKITLDYSGANEYRVKLDNGTWSGWSSLNTYDANGYINVIGVSSIGIHTVQVEIRCNSGTYTTPSVKGEVTFFRL